MVLLASWTGSGCTDEEHLETGWTGRTSAGLILTADRWAERAAWERTCTTGAPDASPEPLLSLKESCPGTRAGLTRPRRETGRAWEDESGGRRRRLNAYRTTTA